MKLKILGHKYELKFDSKLEQKHGAFGIHCGNTLTILIDPTFPLSHQEESLIHEFIEAINFNLGLKLEHQQIIALSSGLFQIFKDNNLLNLKEGIMPHKGKSTNYQSKPGHKKPVKKSTKKK